MKWLLILVLLIAGGYFVYSRFMTKPPASSAYGTAKAFVIAARNNDRATVASLCTDDARESAEQVAAQVASIPADSSRVAYKSMMPRHYQGKGKNRDQERN